MCDEVYVRYGDVQRELLRIRAERRKDAAFPEAMRSLVGNGRTFAKPTTLKDRLRLSPDEFLRCVDLTSIPIRQHVDPYDDPESKIIPSGQGLFAFKVLRHSVRDVHPHNCFDVNYVYRGNAVLDYDGVRTELGEGDLCLVAPGSSYTFECDDDDEQVVLLTVYVRRSVMERTFFDSMASLGIISDFVRNELYSQTVPNYLMFKPHDTRGLNEIMQCIYLETNYPDALSREASIHWLHLLFVAVLRDFDFARSWRGIDGSTVSFYRVLEYIHGHLTDVTLGSVAARFGYNETYFSSLFRERCHQSFRDYVSLRRMERAKELLTTTSLTMEQIATSVGYGSADHFSRKFKRTFGMTPGQFRRYDQG